MRIFRPKTGVGQMQLTDVLQRYVRTDDENVKEAWGAEYAAPRTCSHGAKCKNKKTCEVGKRVQHKHRCAGRCSTPCARPRASSRALASSGHCNACRVIEKKNDEPTADGRRATRPRDPRGIYRASPRGRARLAPSARSTRTSAMP